MNELKYPFDSDYILTKGKKIKRKLLEDTTGMIEKKIAILGGTTTNDIKLILELFLLDNKIKPIFYESEYNKFYEDAVFENNKLNDFKPDLIYICTTNRNIGTYPTLDNSKEEIESLINAEYFRFESIWQCLFNKYNSIIIQNNFEMPLYRLLGNKDAVDIHGRTNFLTRINSKFYDYANNHENFYICDINFISADYGLKKWSNPHDWYMYKYAMDINAIPYLSFNVANIIKSIYGKNKKGFVLDLDNTLWGGIIGDDGVENIVIGEEVAGGEAYIEFQRYLKEHKKLGVILNIDSKNDEKNALAGLNHPNSILKKDDFIDIKANWMSKDKNFLDIASDLSLGTDSLLFIDDNPAERHIVTEQLKDVVAPEIGQIHEYIQNIDRGGYFETTILSEDDEKRNEMYKENLDRFKYQSSFKDYNEYLLSLNMVAIIRPFEDMHLARISQLINKTNQFNLTTKRFTQSEIENISKDKNYITIFGKLEDRFGDNGIVSLIIGKVRSDELDIILFLMSCRVLKRDMEYAMMDELVKCAKEKGVNRIFGYYFPTKKNSMVKDFYKDEGFTKVSEDRDGKTTWMLDVNVSYKNKNSVIKVVN